MKNFPHSNEFFIWAYPEDLVKMGLMVQKLAKGGGKFGDFRWVGNPSLRHSAVIDTFTSY